MKEKKNVGATFRPVARLRGEHLTVAASEKERMEQEFRLRIRQLERREDDFAVFLGSVERERLGDFLLRTGSPATALIAYREAAGCLLDGERYDDLSGGRRALPARMLRIRFLDLVEKIDRCCASDERLCRMVAGDRSLRQLRDRWLKTC